MIKCLIEIWYRLKTWFKKSDHGQQENTNFDENDWSKKSVLYTYEITEELPEIFSEDKIYIIGEDESFWMMGFICPCGCGEFIKLNLLPEAKPTWGFKVKDGDLLTIYPSIWRKRGCKSHFYIRKSKVMWAHTNSENTTSSYSSLPSPK